MIGARLIRQLQRFDWVLFLSMIFLFVLGLSAIYSVELSRESSDFVLIQKHLLAFAIGLVLLFSAANSNPLLFRSYGRGLYMAGIGLMIAVLIFGRTLNGTTGWFIVAGISFQPIEFMKFALAVELARYFGEHARRRFGWREIFGSGFLVALPAGLCLMQPDLGGAILLLALWAGMLFFAGVRIPHIATIGIGATAFAVFAWLFLFAEYQRERVMIFLNPALDPLDRGYNIAQAKIAIGSGQLFGRGLGFGSQSQLKFLPESQTDFIFAVISEELGFLGVMLVLCALAVMLWRIISIASRVRDNFSAYLALAFFTIIFAQSSVNLGVNLAILPATGVGLPFVSYGGSFLVMAMFMIGVVESMAVRLEPGEKSRGAVV